MNSNSRNRNRDRVSRRGTVGTIWHLYYKITRCLVRKLPEFSFRVFVFFVFPAFLVFIVMGFLLVTRGVTTTINVATESLTFSLKEGFEISWVLPAGWLLLTEYDSPSAKKDSGFEDCHVPGQEIEGVAKEWSCRYNRRTRVVFSGPGDINVTVNPDGRWSVVATPGNSENNSEQVGEISEFIVRLWSDTKDTKGKPEPEIASFGINGTSGQQFRYNTFLCDVARNDCNEIEVKNEEFRKNLTRSIRLPIIAATANIGSNVRNTARVNNDLSDFWQPALLSGDVTAFAVNRGFTEKNKGKYQVQYERLDPGDILHIDNRKEKSDDTIRGIATIEKRTVSMSGTAEVRQAVIHAVLHTTHRQIDVFRFGTNDGHSIKAHGWTIISRWPNGQQAWVLFVSMALVLTILLQVGASIDTKRLRKVKKKGKKHTKRKRNSD